MLRQLALCLLPIVAACSSATDRAEQSYRIAKKNDRQPWDRCAAARRVKEAWLAEGDREQYEQWSLEESNACFEARRLGGSPSGQ